MTADPPPESANLQARVTLLERVVGMMVRDTMLMSGKGPKDILAFGESVKNFLGERTPAGASDKELHEAADEFFSAIASDIGSQDSQ